MLKSQILNSKNNMEQKIKLVKMIRDSILLDADYKIKLITEIELLDDNKLAELVRFFTLEQEYVALDREGIEAKINEVLKSFNE